MSHRDSPGADVLDPLPPSDAGTLGDPEIVDASDEAAAHRAADSEMQDTSPQSRAGARTQQGVMTSDVTVTKSRIARAMRREEQEDAKIGDIVERFLKSEADGYFDVWRRGPIEMPSIELGWLGKLTPSELASGSANEILLKRYGGGTYELVPKRSDGTRAESITPTITIGGADPRPSTKIGKAWLARAVKEGTLDDAPPIQKSEDSGGMAQLIIQMMERDKERDRIRADAEAAQRRADAEERKQEWKERQEAAKAERAKELEELKAQREREREEARAQRERDLKEFEARSAREAEASKARLDGQIEEMKLNSAAHIEQMKLDAEIDRDRRKMLLDAEARRMETKDTGGLGLEGLAKVRETIAQAIVSAELKKAGLDEDEDESPGLGGAIADVLRQEGPELVQKISSIFLPKLAEKFLGSGPAAPPAPPPPPQVAHTPMNRLPAPTASPAPAGVPDFSTAGQGAASAPVVEPESAEVPTVESPETPAAAPSGPTPEVALTAAANYALGAVLQFVRPLTVLALAQPDAEAAWDAPVGADGRTLADAFRLMPKNARETAAADWPKFMAAVREASAADADVWDKALAQDGGEAWLEEFLAAGPWVPEVDEA